MVEKVTMQIDENVHKKFKRNIRGDETLSSGLDRIIDEHAHLHALLPILKQATNECSDNVEKGKQSGNMAMTVADRLIRVNQQLIEGIEQHEARSK